MEYNGIQCLKVLKIQKMLIILKQKLKFGNLEVSHAGYVKLTCRK